MRELTDVHYPDAESIRVVQDNLSTLNRATFFRTLRDRKLIWSKDGDNRASYPADLPRALGLNNGLGNDPYRALVYFTRDMQNHHGGVVLVDGVLYGFSNAILTAIDFPSGRTLWRHRSVGKGSLTYADGRLYILSDGLCFSSCLAVVSNWRDLGAIQIGRTTDANTHYSEVRDDLMPSGMATFSTMMGVSAGTPLRLGPFEPAHVFQGDIADTQAVEAWALGLASAPGA